MASCIGRTPGLHSPAATLHACEAAGRGRAFAAMPSSSGLAAVKLLGSRLANSNLLSRGAGQCLAASRRVSPRAPFGVCAAAGRGYHSEGGDGGTVARGPYEAYGTQVDRDELPRPPVIQWEKDLANAVQLIGNVGRVVDIKYLDSGKVLAKTCIAVKRSSQKNEEPSWFEVELWDELAEIAAHHVKKGEQIFVTGRIVVDKWIKDDIQHSVPKVVVRDFCFVESYSGHRLPYGQSNVVQQEDYIEMESNNRSQLATNMGSSQRNWNQQHLVESPSSQGITAAKGGSRSNEEAALATEKRWQEYFADPTQWWDNRNNKKNPKSPDFKHKSTQEALWLDSWNNPNWVLQQMAVLEKNKAQHSGGLGDSHQRSQDKKLSSFRDSDFMY